MLINTCFGKNILKASIIHKALRTYSTDKQGKNYIFLLCLLIVVTLVFCSFVFVKVVFFPALKFGPAIVLCSG